jgi:type IV secretion system protein TrbL
MADCGTTLGIPDPLCVAGNGINSVAGSVAGGAIEALKDAVTEAVGKAVTALGTLWVHVGTPNLTTTDAGSTPSDPVAFLQGSLRWYMLAAAVLAVIVGGAKMAWEGRADPGRDLLKGLITLVVVSGAGLTAIALAVTAADEYAQWVIDRSTQGTDFGTNITALLGLSAVTGIGALLVILMGLGAIFASLLQIGLMVVRGGMLVILAGIFPISASATSTEMGNAWFKKSIGWLIAFVLYKPAAAIVYATAFQLAGSDVFGNDGLVSAVTGLVLMVIAIIALPALLRFVTPLVGAVAGGGGGGSMAAGALAAAPTGAIRVPPASGSPNGSGPSANGGSSSGPSGAAGVAGSRGSSGSDGSSPPPSAGGVENGGGSGASAAARAGSADAGAAGAVPAGAGASGAASGAGAGASGAGAAAGGGAAAAAGPVGAGAAAGAKGLGVAKNAAQGAAESQSGDEGPDGSK